VQRQATTDELTNLVNRRRFIEALEAEAERARVLESPLSVVLADLDDFKRVNDRYGHHGGDEALRAFADLLRGQLRDDDVAGRIGGEEFAILLRDTDLDAAIAVARRTLGALDGATVALGPTTIKLTASFGAAELAADAPPDTLLLDADAALYQAKRDGKNCVRAAPAAAGVRAATGRRLG
jgi:diguanylate cyclase (GGDEF)-like protein